MLDSYGDAIGSWKHLTWLRGFVKGTTVKITFPVTFNAGNTKETDVDAGNADKMAAGTDRPATRTEKGLLTNGKL